MSNYYVGIEISLWPCTGMVRSPLKCQAGGKSGIPPVRSDMFLYIEATAF